MVPFFQPSFLVPKEQTTTRRCLSGPAGRVLWLEEDHRSAPPLMLTGGATKSQLFVDGVVAATKVMSSLFFPGNSDKK